MAGRDAGRDVERSGLGPRRGEEATVRPGEIGRRGYRRAFLAALVALTAALGLPSAASPLPLTSGTVVRVNVGPGGNQQPKQGLTGTTGVFYPAISSNGRYVAFTSGTAGLVAVSAKCKKFGGRLNGSQIYRRDLSRGVTELVSVRPDGCPGSSGGVGSVSMSSDGRDVAFVVAAEPYGRDDIVPGFHPAGGTVAVYLRDMVKHHTVAVSVGYDGRGNNADAMDPSISADGRYVAFASYASNLVRHDSRPAGVQNPEIYVRDVRNGRTERIGLGSRQVSGTQPSISANGRYIAFGSGDQDLDGTPNYAEPLNPVLPFHDEGGGQIYIYDRATRHFTMASRSDTGISGNNESEAGPSGQTLSADGRYVTFMSNSTNLVPGDDSAPTGLEPDPTEDIYVYDRVAHHLARVSRGPSGIPGDYGSAWPAISANGRWIVFYSGATNLGDVDATAPVTDFVPTGFSVGYDIYLHDQLTGANTLISRSVSGIQGDFSSWNPVVSGDGATIAYISDADNLVSNDTNSQPDVFAWRQP